MSVDSSLAPTNASVSPAVILDNGGGVIRAGFAGTDAPRVTFQAWVGRPKHARVMVSALEGDTFVGARANELRGLLSIRRPTHRGVASDWRDVERLWRHAYDELGAHADEHPILLTESAWQPLPERARAAELLFETFQVPALFISPQSVLSLYGSGRTTGLVLDSGDGCTACTPIFEGFAVRQAVLREDVAGRDVTEHLQRLLRRQGHVFRTSAEVEVVRTIKEKACFVAADVEKEAAQRVDYKLPDGNLIELGAERYRAAEILFSPQLIGSEALGVHELLQSCVARADMDLRKTLYSNIVLSGGNTLLTGFGDRLFAEVRRAQPTMKLQMSAPLERHHSSWTGGSVLASLGTFSRMWLSKERYEDEGAFVLERLFL